MFVKLILILLIIYISSHKNLKKCSTFRLDILNLKVMFFGKYQYEKDIVNYQQKLLLLVVSCLKVIEMIRVQEVADSIFGLLLFSYVYVFPISIKCNAIRSHLNK